MPLAASCDTRRLPRSNLWGSGPQYRQPIVTASVKIIIGIGSLGADIVGMIILFIMLVVAVATP